MVESCDMVICTNGIPLLYTQEYCLIKYGHQLILLYAIKKAIGLMKQMGMI